MATAQTMRVCKERPASRARDLLRAIVVLSLLSVAPPSTAAEGEPRLHRLVRVYDWTNGFPWSYTGGLEQDRRGFLWVATTSGLYRFDGKRAYRVTGPGFGLAPGSTQAGRIVVHSVASEPTWEAKLEGLAPLDEGVAGSDPDPLFVTVAADGTPWRVRAGTLERLGEDRVWSAFPLPESDPPRHVRPGRGSRMYVMTASSFWIVEPAEPPRLLARIDRPVLALERADGTVVVGANQPPGPVTTRLFEVSGESIRMVYEEHGARLLSIAERGEEIWIATDRGLQGLGPGYEPRGRLTPPQIPATGHLLVDQEGSLWMATPRGVVQIPDPGVYAVQPPGAHVTRTIARTDRGVWGTFWGVLAFVHDEPASLRMVGAGDHFAWLCADAAGRVWTARPGRMLRLEQDGTTGPEFPSDLDPHACGEGEGGRRWIVSGGSDLWTVGPDDDRPWRMALRRDDLQDITAVTEARDGMLWLASGARACAAPAAALLSGSDAAWRCEEIRGAGVVYDLQAMPSGDVWAVTLGSPFIRRRAGGRWEAMPGAEQLEVSFVTTLMPSPKGGFWVAGQGLLARVAERPDDPVGLEVLERPTVWNGLMTLNISGVHEDPDGTLWLATDLGIQRIPSGIRARKPGPPAVQFVEGAANGEPIETPSPIRLPYRRNRIAASFAALSYRDPSAVRYRMRLREGDPWSPPSATGQFTFVDLPAGRYDLQVIASLDGVLWSEPAARLAFRVMRPWYVEPWVLGGAALAIAALGHTGYRLRVRRRLARESQRTRIAMDLHDEVGSGLGTIAVLAGVVGRPDLPESRRGDVAERIAAVSQELARSLTDIVWSLRASSGSLDALWNQLLDRARPLSEAGQPRVTFEAPDPVPAEALSLVVRRNLHLVAYEALHNAIRHSGASIVAVRLARDGHDWRLEVEDDGRGHAATTSGPAVRRGLGIEAIRARVTEMGGAIAWDHGELGGTRVTVRFRTGGE